MSTACLDTQRPPSVLPEGSRLHSSGWGAEQVPGGVEMVPEKEGGEKDRDMQREKNRDGERKLSVQGG